MFGAAVRNKLVFEDAGMVFQVVGGPNQRGDFHEEFYASLTERVMMGAWQSLAVLSSRRNSVRR